MKPLPLTKMKMQEHQTGEPSIAKGIMQDNAASAHMGILQAGGQTWPAGHLSLVS